MKIEQIYTGCLAQGTYYIISGNEAVIIDPLREIEPYLQRAKNDGVTIKYILETHFHADFVSGHIDLAKASGAQIVFGPNAQTSYNIHVAEDGEILNFGSVSLKVLHTPGHTMESSCFLLRNENGDDYALFSGDTLFIGDVGRPDLAQKSESLTMEQLAAKLYHSLRHKIMTLADNVLVYPAHGAGSACGKHMSKETISTIGEQKANNYALRKDMTEDEFIKEVTDGLLPPPGYFGMNVQMNKSGYDSIQEVLKRGVNPLSLDEFESIVNHNSAIILDTRNAEDFAIAFIPNSINIGLDGQFAPWVGALIPNVKQPIVLITEKGREEEAVTRLARVGYDLVVGFLIGGIDTWINSKKDVDKITRISADQVAQKMDEGFQIIDVRKPGEYSAEHIEGAENIPLDFLNEHMNNFPKDIPFILHCAGGYRSMVAASILKSRGIANFMEVRGGFNAISKTGVPLTNFVCQSASKLK
jgi:glyoxylase-like metal-dependent hydrolase (beta-lactamase superfamily II)/rhodanese-related sulfurtransferase